MNENIDRLTDRIEMRFCCLFYVIINNTKRRWNNIVPLILCKICSFFFWCVENIFNKTNASDILLYLYFDIACVCVCV